MHMHIATTPFGRRTYTLGQAAAEAQARERPPGAQANKWEVFRALCAARGRLDLSERSLAVLDALLSFHPETVLAGDRLVVFPSNAQLALRAHGMAASTLRRHLAALVERGLVLRRDSPNGKRYARKGRDGEIARAFGFDLSPLVSRAGEFAQLAQEERDKAQALRHARERVTLARRDLAKMIAAAIETQAPGDWDQAAADYRALLAALPRRPDLEALREAAQALERQAHGVASVLEMHAKAAQAGGNESRIERHQQSSDSEPYLESERLTEMRAAPPSLELTLRACPDIVDYARHGVGGWGDLIAAADVARAAMGVSADAWGAARAAMGPSAAAVVVAAMLQRGAAISRPGGYLRELTRKAGQGGFSPGPMVMALARGAGHAAPS